MRHLSWLAALVMAVFPLLAQADVQAFPASFRNEQIQIGDVTLHVRVGGTGPAVLLIHGYGETGDMWQPLAAKLVGDHRVIVPDLRGMGRSSHPAGGYDKKTQGGDMSSMLNALKVDKVAVVGHDIGNMVAYAFAAHEPERVIKLVLMDAPLPGIGPWSEILKSPLLWHFRFGGPDMERLVKGRERIYLDRFWNEFSADPKSFNEASRRHYAKFYTRPGAMRSGFEQFRAFDQDAIDNTALLAKGPLPMPVLAIGGEKSFGTAMEVVARAAASDVQGAVIPGAGHWLMEEQPAATVSVITKFLESVGSPIRVQPNITSGSMR